MLVRAGLVLLAALVLGRTHHFRETELQRAIRAHDVESVRRLLAGGAHTGSSLAEPYGAHELALKGLSPVDGEAVEVLRLVLARLDAEWSRTSRRAPRPANETFRAGSRTAARSSALELAAGRCSRGGVEVLLEYGATVQGPGMAGALSNASTSPNCVPVLRLLLDAGVDPNTLIASGLTALDVARQWKNAPGAALLLGRGGRGLQSAEDRRAAQRYIATGRYSPPDDATSPTSIDEVWLEGAEVLRSPVAQAAVTQGASPDAIRMGSVLFVRGTEAELYVALPPPATGGATPPVPEIARYGMTSIGNGTWVPAPVD